MTLLSRVFFRFGSPLLHWNKTLHLLRRKKAILDIPNERSSTLSPPHGAEEWSSSPFFLPLSSCAPSFSRGKPPLACPPEGGWPSLPSGGSTTEKPSQHGSAWHPQPGCALGPYHFGGMPSLSLGFTSLPPVCLGHSFLSRRRMDDQPVQLHGWHRRPCWGEAVLVSIMSAFLTTGTPVSLPLFALAASVLGFLLWNGRPRKSSWVMPAVASWVSPSSASPSTPRTATSAPPHLGRAPSVFAVDATLTLVMRARQRKHLSEAHRDHLYQQFIKAGSKHSTVSSVILLATAFLSLLSFFFQTHVLVLFIAVYSAVSVAWKRLYTKITVVNSKTE